MTVENIKNATIGLGLVDVKHTIHYVGGTGVVIDSRGYFLTASHVLSHLEEKRHEFANLENEKRILTNLAMISYIPRSGGNYSIITNPIEKWVPYELEIEKLDIDIALGWPIQKEVDHPYLKVSQRTSFSPLEKIMMCGYPGGNTTLSPYGSIIDVTLSPMAQDGKISSLIPGDDANVHQGMTLNIISTGGSSGSPIIDENNEVIGIAQWVIGGGLEAIVDYEDSTYMLNEKKLVEKILKKHTVVNGFAQVGNVFALSSSMFRDSEKAIQQIEDGSNKITGLNAMSSGTVYIKTISKVEP